MPETSFMRWFYYPPMHVARRTFGSLMLLAAVGGAIAAARFYGTLPSLEFGAEGATLNGLILAFLVGFRNNASYQRWWEARMQWGKLVNDSRNLCLKYREHAYPSFDECRQMQMMVSGFAIALKDHLRNVDCAPGAQHVPIEYAGRVHSAIARLKSQQRIDSIQAQMLDVHASGFMDVSGACERIRGTPLADSYRALLRRAMTLQLLAIVVLTTWELGAMGLAVVIIPAYFLIGMELTAEDIENPFDSQGDDLDLDKYCATIRRSTEQILMESSQQSRAMPTSAL
jgi:putative membrane protein